MFEKAEAYRGARAGATPQRQPGEILLHLSGDPIEQLQTFLFFGARGGGGASLLREAQLGLEARQIFLLPNSQNTLCPSGGGHGEIVYTLVRLSARPGNFIEK
jgi:hypothetical protein